MATRFRFVPNDSVLAFCTHYAGAAAVLQDCGLPEPADTGITLAEHCRAAGQDVEPVLLRLARHLRWKPTEDDDRYGELLLVELVDDILANHHALVDAELGRLAVLLRHACRGPQGFLAAFATFRREMIQHMADEERDVFPLARRDMDGQIDSVDEATRQIEHDHHALHHGIMELCRMAESANWSDPTIAILVCDTLGLLRHDLDLHGRKEDEYLIPAILHRLERGSHGHVSDTGTFRRRH